MKAVNRPRFEHYDLLRAANIEATLRADFAHVHSGSLRDSDGKRRVDGGRAAAGPDRQYGLVDTRLQDAVRWGYIEELSERLVSRSCAVESRVVFELDDRIAPACERSGNARVERARVYGRVRADDPAQRRGSPDTGSFGTAKTRKPASAGLVM